jgi:hypothetical protein
LCQLKQKFFELKIRFFGAKDIESRFTKNGSENFGSIGPENEGMPSGSIRQYGEVQRLGAGSRAALHFGFWSSRFL